jgi:type I restriction enzyme S subunit
MPLQNAFWFQEGPGVRTSQFTNAGVKLLNVSNITKSGQLDLGNTNRFLSHDEVSAKYAHFLVDAGDLVIASSGVPFDADGLLRTRGAFVLDEHLPLCMNTSTIRFKALDGISDLRFLRHWFQSLEFRRQITRFVTGTAQQNFGPSHLKATTICLPPLPEQKRIAAILDKAEALGTKRLEVLSRSTSLCNALFREMFGDPIGNDRGWQSQTVGDFVAAFEGGKNIVSTDEDDRTSRNRVLKVSAVTSLRYRPEETKPVPDSYVPPSEHFVQTGDLLFSRANTCELVGATAYVFSTPPNLLLPDKIWRFVWRDPSKVDPLFVWYLFQHESFRREIGKRATGTSGSMKNISQAKTLSIKTILPPIDKQREFAGFVKSSELLRQRHCKSKSKLDSLYTTLQHRAFRGEL